MAPRARVLMQLATWLLLSMTSLGASAQTRAWLDRDRIGLDETVTLNIETTSAMSAAPDYSPLNAQFRVTGNTSRRQFELSNGRAVERTLYAVALQPRREGLLTIPALTVGSQRTDPLTLMVTAGSTRTPARAGAEVFIESEADDQDPFVQQAVGLVVRLYSAVPLVSGQLDQPAPEGASLQRVGDDAQYTRQIGERRYTVVERRYTLIPERSGTLTIPGATFEGRGAAGFFDDFFGGRGGALQAQAPPRFLQVRPAPAHAPQPWLPLHDLQLRYQTTPQSLRGGAAATLTIEVTADGATAAQMPDLELPPIDGVQVFAEPVQADETFANGRPQVKLTRKFSLVPAAAGEVRLDGLRLGWWDVLAGAARVASLPPLTWQVATGSGATAAALPTVAAPGGAAPAEAGSAEAGPAALSTGASTATVWAMVAAVFAALWLVTLLWALNRRGTGPSTAAVASGVAAPASEQPRIAALRRVLAVGDFADVAHTLCAMARPAAKDVDELTTRLDDPAQRQAVEAMQRARWADGDGVAARSLLRRAFADGPRWRVGPVPPAEGPEPLPPLYPPR